MRELHALRRILLLLFVGLLPQRALGHGGNPAQALILSPGQVGPPVSDAFLIEWLDAGPPPPITGSARVNLYYTRDLPYAFPLGVMHPTLTGTAIATGILEELDPNELLWDVSNVPSGHYWIWSRVDDPPEEMSAQYIRFSPAPVTVLHPGDEIGPVIALLKPQSEFSTADQFYTVDYESWDPTGTARIRLEVSEDAFRTEPEWFVIADNVAAQPKGVLGWNTAGLPQGDYMLRATITDCTGKSFVTHSRYFIFVAHLDPPDAGPLQGPNPDGGSLEEWCTNRPEDSGVPPADAGVPDGGAAAADATPMVEPPGEGCGCTAGGRPPVLPGAAGWAAFVLALLLLLRPQRSRRGP